MTWLGQPYAPASPREAIDKGLVHDPPGAQAPAGALDRRERLRRPLADEGRPRRSRGHGRARAGAACAAQPASRRRRARCRVSRPRSSSWSRSPRRWPEREAPDPRRADGRAWRRGNRGCSSSRCASSGPKASGSSTSRIGWRRSVRSPTASSCCATASGWRTSPTARRPVRTVVESMVGRSLERMFPPIPQPKAARGAGGAGPDRRERSVPRRHLLGGGGRDPRDRRAGRRRADGARAGDRRRRSGERRDDLARRAGAEPDESRRRHRRGHRDGARGPQAPGPRRRASDRREHRLREPRQGRAQRLDHEVRRRPPSPTGPSRSSA